MKKNGNAGRRRRKRSRERSVRSQWVVMDASFFLLSSSFYSSGSSFLFLVGLLFHPRRSMDPVCVSVRPMKNGEKGAGLGVSMCVLLRATHADNSVKLGRTRYNSV